MIHPWIAVLVLFSGSLTSTTLSSTTASTSTPKASTNQDSSMLTSSKSSNSPDTTVASTSISSNKPTETSTSFTTIAPTPTVIISSSTATPTVPSPTSVNESTATSASISTSAPTVTSENSNITTPAPTTVKNSTTTPTSSGTTGSTPTPTPASATPATVTLVTTGASSDTAASTAAPTTVPTEAPTTASTAAPTAVPTAAPTAPVTKSTMAPLTNVVISETNLLLETDKDIYFVELQVKHAGPAYVWLAFYNATNFSSPLQLVNFTLNNGSSGFYVFYVEKEVLQALQNVSSVGIAVYAEKEYAINRSTEVGKLYDILWYSSQTCISGNKDQHLGGPCLVIDVRKLGPSELSLSRCSESYAGGHSVLTMSPYAGYHSVLTTQSPNAPNNCTLTSSKALEMKLNKVFDACSSTGETSVNDSFQLSLVNSLIADVNSLEYCGLALPMLYDLNVTQSCNKTHKEVNVQLSVKAAFDRQLSSIVTGYQMFVSRPIWTLGQESFTVDCVEGCFSKNSPNPGADDDKTRVTVAVVVSCVGVFLILLLLVILYMRRKQRGNHQFRMSRLDEEDDLAGDMDDFIGSQGATFRSFK